MWIARSTVLLLLLAMPGFAPLLFEVNAHDLSRIALILVATVCAAALAGRAIAGTNDERWPRPLAWGAAALGLLALASVLHAADRSAAARELATLLGLLSIVAVVAGARQRQQRETLAIIVVVAALLYALLLLFILAITIAHGGPLERSNVFLGYINHRFFNHAQTVVLPLLVIATSRTFQQGALARLAWIALTLNFAFLVFTLGRATALALIVGAVVSLLLFRRAALPLARHLLTGAAIGALVYLGLFVVAPTLTGASAQALAPDGAASLQGDHSRLMLWRLALDYLAREPWLGIGPMHYAHYANAKAAHPHNLYLQIASEWGLPMLAALLALSAWAAWRMARAIQACTDPAQTSMGIALFTAVIAIAVDALFSGNFVMPMSQAWIALLIGWAMAWTCANSVPAVRAAAGGFERRVRAGLAVGLLVSQAWLIGSIAPEVVDLRAHLEHVHRDISKVERLCPRFWSDGWF